ncbi:MAG: hypothetical protein FH756_05905 [Firmicutes bacterium]|nr:hypothetical protein [Bacillota bacterium]
MSDKEKTKPATRKLEEIDDQGRIFSTRIVHDLDDMILESFPELKDDYGKIQAKKKRGKVLRYPSK